jgi:hypothetical protein
MRETWKPAACHPYLSYTGGCPQDYGFKLYSSPTFSGCSLWLPAVVPGAGVVVGAAAAAVVVAAAAEAAAVVVLAV